MQRVAAQRPPFVVLRDWFRTPWAAHSRAQSEALSVAGDMFLGEVVHARQEKQNWLAGMNFERRISEADLRRLLNEYSRTS